MVRIKESKKNVQQIIEKTKLLEAVKKKVKAEDLKIRTEKRKALLKRLDKKKRAVEKKISKAGLRLERKLTKKRKKYKPVLKKTDKITVKIKKSEPAPYINRFFNKENIKGRKSYI